MTTDGDKPVQQRTTRHDSVFPTFRGRGPRAGVNLDDSAHLLELMERDRYARLRRYVRGRTHTAD